MPGIATFFNAFHRTLNKSELTTTSRSHRVRINKRNKIRTINNAIGRQIAASINNVRQQITDAKGVQKRDEVRAIDRAIRPRDAATLNDVRR